MGLRFQRVVSVIFFMAATCLPAVLMGKAAAQSNARALPPALMQKTATPGDITTALDQTGRVRVLVEVSLGLRRATVAADIREAASRAAAKREIRTAVDAVIGSNGLTTDERRPGYPAIMRLTTVPVFAVTVSRAELVRLASDPRVLSINIDAVRQRNLNVTLPLIGMTTVHSGGGTGAGNTVVVIDDGVQRDHPFLGISRLIPGREGCFLSVSGCPNGSNEQIGTGAGAAAAGKDHGTHVAGIALGSRAAGTPLRGVAPAARLIPINIFGGSSFTSTSNIHRALEYVEDIVLASNASLKIASVNMSLGGGSFQIDCDAESADGVIKPVVDNLYSNNVVTVASAGNNYQLYRMSSPSCLSSIVSVAATSRSGVPALYTNISSTTDVLRQEGTL